MPAYSRSALSSFPRSSNSIARRRAYSFASSQSRSKLQAVAFAELTGGEWRLDSQQRPAAFPRVSPWQVGKLIGF